MVQQRSRSGVLQPYTVIAKNKGGKLKGEIWSDNDLYFLQNAADDYIWALNTAPAPRASIATGFTDTRATKIYGSYKSASFLKDCLHTAEEIMADGPLQFGAGVYSDAVAGQPFGESDAKNIALATALAAGKGVDAAASPALGQSYAIVRQAATIGNQSPYHAAAIVAVDGTDHFTLEQNAGGDGIDADQKTLDTGIYYVYSTNDTNGKSFHTRHSPTYANGVTFALKASAAAVPAKTFATRNKWHADYPTKLANKFKF
jgi:hypothetical protein